jgi:nucleotidyltransferase substrate binding protein (TIGR01987 family)
MHPTMIDYGKFQKALKHLELQHLNHQGMDPSLDTLTREAIAESVIQRFETTYDCLWKVLKRHLGEALGLPDLPNSPKPLLRIAAENQLLPSPTERWLAYADARTDTAHDYSGEKMESTLALIPDFVSDAIRLYQTLTDSPWA